MEEEPDYLVTLQLSPQGEGVQPQRGKGERPEAGEDRSMVGLPTPERGLLRSQRSLITMSMREKTHPKTLNRIFRKGRAHQHERAWLQPKK